MNGGNTPHPGRPASRSPRIPVAQARRQWLFVGDFGDNLSAGASGDVPFVLAELLRRDLPCPSVLLCGLTDPQAVRACRSVRPGTILRTLRVGAALHASHAGDTKGGAPLYGPGCGPLILERVQVCAMANGGSWAVVRVRHVTIVLQEASWAFFSRSDFERLPPSCRPQRFTVTVMKLGINLQDTMEAAGTDGARTHCCLANTPGSTTEPLPKRSNLAPEIYPVNPCRQWVAPPGERLR